MKPIILITSYHVGDVHPSYYNEDIIADNLKICDRRDQFEMQLAKLVLH